MNRRTQPVPDRTRQRWRDDRGSESVELAILLPVGILILAMLVIGARIALAGDRISGVAGIAARDASLARSAAAAQQAATASATDALADRDLHCATSRCGSTPPGSPAPRAPLRRSPWPWHARSTCPTSAWPDCPAREPCATPRPAPLTLPGTCRDPPGADPPPIPR